MRRKADDFENRLQLKLKSHLEGKTISEWCKYISNQYLLETNQSEPPFSIVKYLPLRKITTIHDTKISVTGTIKPIDTGFLLSINPEKIKSEQYYNLTIAHEIAHTFFYNINDNTTDELSGLTPGSKYLEYICRKLARFFIIPSNSIEKEITKFPAILSKDFNLSIINDLMHTFNTSSFVLLTRLITDENIWDALLLRFKYYNDLDSWKLIEYFKQNDLFIPPANKRKEQNDSDRYPTAKNELNNFMNNIYLELKESKRLYKNIEIGEMDGPPLTSIFADLDKNENILVHFSLDKTNNIINILLPLNQKVFL